MKRYEFGAVLLVALLAAIMTAAIASVAVAGTSGSAPATLPSVAGTGTVDPPTETSATPVAVYRFFNPRLGVHFYTADDGEKASVIANLGSVYTYEGVGYYVNPTSNTQPLHRFYNRRVGVHFYTASDVEKANVIERLSGTYTYEGVAYGVSSAPGPYSTAVNRFYNRRTGTHFYTADATETANVIATLGSIYTFEGSGFWLAP